MSNVGQLKPVLPKNGQMIIEDVQDLVLCKPHLIPLKSFTLEKLEKMQREAQSAKSQTEEKTEGED